MAIEIRLLKDEERKYANDFHLKIYQHGRTLEQFEWEFFSGPCGKAIYVVAVDTEKGDENRIVGTQCAIPLQMIDGNGQVILTAKSEDTLIDPAYRGRNIFERMYELLFEKCREAGILYIWGFTYVKKPFQKVGFQIPFSATQGVLVNKPFLAFKFLKGLNQNNRLKEKIQIGGLCMISYFKTLFTSFGNFHEGYTCVEGILKNKNALQKIAIQERSDLFFLDQNEKYTSWRISDNPFSNRYTELNLLNPDGARVGNLLCNIRPEGHGYICQTFFNPDVPRKIRRIFINKAINHLRKQGAFIIRYWGFKTNLINLEEARIMASSGFTIIDKGVPFVWKDLSVMEGAKKPGNILLSRIYTQGNN